MRSTMATSSMSNSIRELDRVEDRIRLHWQADKRPALVVEGDDDALVLRPHFEQHAVVFRADGRNNAVRAARELRKSGHGLFCAVVDRDFGEEEVLDELADVLVAYDGRDLESMLISLGVLAKLADFLSSKSKLSAAGGSEALVARVIEVAMPVARLRSANATNRWGLRFDDVDLADKVDLKTLDLKLEGYCRALIDKSDRRLELGVLMEAAALPVGDDFGPRGKDVVALFGVALRRLVGDYKQAASREPLLSAPLRSSCEPELGASKWLSSVRDRLTLS